MTTRPQASPSVVFDRMATPRIAVAGGERSWVFLAGLAGVAVLGLIVFFNLSHGRAAHAATRPPPPVVAAVRQVATVAPPVVAPPPPQVFEGDPPPITPVPDASHWSSPTLVVDLSEPGSTPQGNSGDPAVAARDTQPPAADAGAAGRNTSGTGYEGDPFAARVGSTPADTVYAHRLRNTALIVPQGTVIPAILETGINSDLPGFVRGVVSRDVHGFDGSTVLIPRGSKLIGQYRNAVATGVTRAFVVWSRLLTPQGVSIDIGSPATDQLGRGGLEGETKRISSSASAPRSCSPC